MMNIARLSVGLSGLVIGERSYQQALDCVIERRQGAVGASAGEDSPIIEHADVRRMPCMRARRGDARTRLPNAGAVDIARHGEDDDARRRAGRVDLHADHEGLVHRHGHRVAARDAGPRRNGVHRGTASATATSAAAIYEGTNGIQAMDLVGRKLPMQPAWSPLEELSNSIPASATMVRCRRDPEATTGPHPRCDRTEQVLRRDPISPHVRHRGRLGHGFARPSPPEGRSRREADDGRFYLTEPLPQAGCVRVTAEDVFCRAFVALDTADGLYILVLVAAPRGAPTFGLARGSGAWSR